MSTPAVTAASLLSHWTFRAPMAAVALALGAGYLLGLSRVAGSGGWPRLRTWAFLGGGVGSFVVCTMSGLEVDARSDFWVAALQYTLVLTVVPVLLALGEPVALAQRALGERGTARLVRGLRSRPVRVLTFPGMSALLVALTQLAVYLTPYFSASLQHRGVGDLLVVQLLATGCLFTVPMLAEDLLPAWCTYPVRMSFAFLDGLLDAVPGIVVMTSSRLFAGGVYAATQGGSFAALQHDQQVGGALMLTVAETIGIPFLGLVFVQWYRDDARAARRADLELDRRTDLAWQPAAAAAGPEPVAPSDRPDQLMRPWWELDSRLDEHPAFRRAQPRRPRP